MGEVMKASSPPAARTMTRKTRICRALNGPMRPARVGGRPVGSVIASNLRPEEREGAGEGAQPVEDEGKADDDDQPATDQLDGPTMANEGTDERRCAVEGQGQQ